MAFKYNEDALLQELRDYISGTYNQHYSAGNDSIQTLDLIEACGDAEAFCRSNILKYASRYDKKGTARRDIIKILHYGLLLLHFSDKTSVTETLQSMSKVTLSKNTLDVLKNFSTINSSIVFRQGVHS